MLLHGTLHNDERKAHSRGALAGQKPFLAMPVAHEAQYASCIQLATSQSLLWAASYALFVQSKTFMTSVTRPTLTLGDTSYCKVLTTKPHLALLVGRYVGELNASGRGTWDEGRSDVEPLGAVLLDARPDGHDGGCRSDAAHVVHDGPPVRVHEEEPGLEHRVARLELEAHAFVDVVRLQFQLCFRASVTGRDSHSAQWITATGMA